MANAARTAAEAKSCSVILFIEPSPLRSLRVDPHGPTEMSILRHGSGKLGIKKRARPSDQIRSPGGWGIACQNHRSARRAYRQAFGYLFRPPLALAPSPPARPLEYRSPVLSPRLLLPLAPAEDKLPPPESGRPGTEVPEPLPESPANPHGRRVPLPPPPKGWLNVRPPPKDPRLLSAWAKAGMLLKAKLTTAVSNASCQFCIVCPFLICDPVSGSAGRSIPQLR
jgi:hypothetical protein